MSGEHEHVTFERIDNDRMKVTDTNTGAEAILFVASPGAYERVQEIQATVDEKRHEFEELDWKDVPL